MTLTSTAGLDKCRFNYGTGIHKQWVESNSLFFNVVVSRFGQSVKAYIEAGELVVTEVDKVMLARFDTEEVMKAHMETLKYWEQELHSQAK